MKSYLAFLKLSTRMLMRTPAFWVPSLIFPAMLYAFFGLRVAQTPYVANFVAASFSVYAVIGVAFFQFGVGVALNRESAFSVWQRTLPVSPVFAWLAQLSVTIAFTFVAVLLVQALGAVIGGTAMSISAYVKLALTSIFISVPATLMGTALGYYATSRSAVALGNLIFLPLAFLGGLWIPPYALPELVNAISWWTPTRHMGEMAWAAVGDHAIPITSFSVLIAYTLIFFALTYIGWKQDERLRFG